MQSSLTDSELPKEVAEDNCNPFPKCCGLLHAEHRALQGVKGLATQACAPESLQPIAAVHKGSSKRAASTTPLWSAKDYKAYQHLEQTQLRGCWEVCDVVLVLHSASGSVHGVPEAGITQASQMHTQTAQARRNLQVKKTRSRSHKLHTGQVVLSASQQCQVLERWPEGHLPERVTSVFFVKCYYICNQNKNVFKLFVKTERALHPQRVYRGSKKYCTEVKNAQSKYFCSQVTATSVKSSSRQYPRWKDRLRKLFPTNNYSINNCGFFFKTSLLDIIPHWGWQDTA